MTIHASNELVRAMSGVVPLTAASPDDNDNAMDGSNMACAPSSTMMSERVWACDLVGQEHAGLVDCPDCLRLMRLATDPVRYDFLRERGLVPELPLVSG